MTNWTRELVRFAQKQDVFYKTKFCHKYHGGTESLQRSANVINGESAHIIAFRYPAEVTDTVREFSYRLSKRFPVMPYDETNCHTSIAVIGKKQGLHSPDDKTSLILKNTVSHGLESARKSHVKIPSVSFGDWMFNRNAVIAPGYPDEAYLMTCSRISELNNLIEMPSAAHMTIARVNGVSENGMSDVALFMRRDFCTLEYNRRVAPERIDVGHYNLDTKGFRLNVHESFKL